MKMLADIGIHTPMRAQVALWCDASPTSGSYANNLSVLSKAGMIEYKGGGLLALTEAGHAHANESPVMSQEEVHEMLFQKVKPTKAAILRELIRVYPESVDRATLAQTVGASPTSGSYANNLSELSTLGVISYPEKGRVAASPVCFLP